jgi:hypothetical protein
VERVRTHLTPWIALLRGACLAASCTSAGTLRAEPTTTTVALAATITAPTTTTTTILLPDPEPVRWAGCGDGFDCATVVVPATTPGKRPPTRRPMTGHASTA